MEAPINVPPEVPDVSVPQKKNSKTWLIILIIVLVLCCCCTIGAVVIAWNYGDQFMQYVNPSSFLMNNWLGLV